MRRRHGETFFHDCAKGADEIFDDFAQGKSLLLKNVKEWEHWRSAVGMAVLFFAGEAFVMWENGKELDRRSASGISVLSNFVAEESFVGAREGEGKHAT